MTSFLWSQVSLEWDNCHCNPIWNWILPSHHLLFLRLRHVWVVDWSGVAANVCSFCCREYRTGCSGRSPGNVYAACPVHSSASAGRSLGLREKWSGEGERAVAKGGGVEVDERRVRMYTCTDACVRVRCRMCWLMFWVKWCKARSNVRGEASRRWVKLAREACATRKWPSSTGNTNLTV